MITQEYLKSLLSYDTSTGLFVWLYRPGTTREDKIFNTRFFGKVAGRSKPDAYGYNTITIRVDGKIEYFRAHRLAWLYVYGEFPPDGVDLDHINYDPWDNRIDNLRIATRSQNNFNSDPCIRNTTGHKGVIWDKERFLWRAEIRKDGKNYHLGRFSDFDRACKVWQNKAIELYGEYARIQG